MAKTMSATEARIHFGEVMRDAVERGETIVVERAGQPQVVVLSLAEYERLRSQNGGQEDDWWARVVRSQERFRAEWGDRPTPDISRIIHESREERDAAILDGLL